MIQLQRDQPSFGDGMIAAEVGDLWEPWMKQADRLLEDPSLLALTQQELGRRVKPAKPTEFGKMVKIQEAENQIIIDYEAYKKRPNDSDLLIPSIEVHEKLLKRTPRLVAADAGFYSAKNEKEAKAKGVKWVSVPNRSTKSQEKRKDQKKRWFRKGQKWRTVCEGRISILKRRHGLTRSRYKGDEGLERWVGLGVIADNLINIGTQLAQRDQQRKPKMV